MNDEILEKLSQKEPGGSIITALEKLITQDKELLKINANERSITHRFAMYLQESYDNLNVDCEYNREGHEPKELMFTTGEPDSYDTNAKTVYPDVIVHKRCTNDNNYLVMEFKKSTSNENNSTDIKKLVEFKHQLDYKFAIFIVVSTEPQNPGIAHIEWIDT